MRWDKVKLGDIANCIQPGPFGSQLHSSDYADEGTPIIMPKDMVGGKIYHHDLIRVPDEHLQRLKRHQVYDGDLMVARKGDVRKCVYITENEGGWLTGSDCLKVSLDKSRCYPKYIYYQLRSPFIGKWLETISVGATMPSLNTGLLSGIEIALPAIEEQKQIAKILSAYDDFIENNQKQIKLLEEAAQRLYREWFINLRFPGHETTPIVDGIPEGWTWGTLADIAVFRRGKTITKDQVNAGIIPVVAGGLDPAYYHDTPNTDVPVVTVSGSGANAGFTRMYYTKVWASDCSYIDAAATKNIAWVYCFLKGNKASIDAMQKGAAQPHVYAKDLNAMKTLFPDDKLMERFRVIANPMFTRIGKLDMQIKCLTEARDRLLPKLMHGEIEV